MRTIIAVVLSLLIGAALGAGGLWFYLSREKEKPRPVEHEKSEPPGDQRLHVDVATQKTAGIVASPLHKESIRREAFAYGKLEEDPARTFTIRAPFSGTISAPASRNYPKLADPIADGAVAALLTPRIAPLERADLRAKTAAARAERAALDPQVAQARTAYNRAKELNADDKNVSDRVVEEAKAKVAELEARIAGADTAVQLYESLSNPSSAQSGAFAPIPLLCARGGEVAEILARPGESVEAGQAILRVANFDHLLARVEMRPGDAYDPLFTNARVFVIGDESLQFTGVRIAAAAVGDRGAIATAYLLDCASGSLPLRPGLAVVAAIPAPGAARDGYIIPRSAIVRALGKAWVYVQIGDDGFARKEVPLEDPVDGGWIALSGFEANDKIVISGSQMLLSEELKSLIPSDEEKK